MKRQDFTRYLVLHEQLDKARNCLLDLQEAAVPGAQVLTGMPHAPGVKDKVGNLAIEIADTKASIRDMEEEMEALRAEISAFIEEIPYPELKMIFRLRFLRWLSWDDIAEVFRWRYHETTLRKKVHRYIKRNCSSDDTHVP